MQPPPRKGNYAKFLKTLHSEQVAKLQAKNQHECDLLEDIRNFTLKRSAIEKSYSEALLKISSAFLNKKIPNIPDIKTSGGEEKWNMWNVWRTVLEENEKLARARLAAVEVFHQQIADDAKVLRAQKVQAARKSVDQIIVIQKEMQTCVQEVDKTKKFYFDEEHSAHDVRDKAKDIEEKLKKKKGSFFQSITSLQKNSARVSSKRDALEEKSTGARNDYLLSLASANAHQTRYFVVDLQSTMTTMENQVFEKVAEYLTLIGRTELLTCSATQHSFGRIRDQAQQLTREYNLQCLYLYYPVLKQHIQYEFEPCENDNVDKVTADIPSAVVVLSKEARRWATRIGRENNNIREYFRKLQMYHQMRDAGQRVDPNDQNGPDLDSKIDDMRLNIRKAETAKVKAEARIECLRAGGVNVDEWMQEIDSLSVQDMARSTSSLSVRTDASGAGEPPSSDSFYDSDYEGGADTATADQERALVSESRISRDSHGSRDSRDSRVSRDSHDSHDADSEKEDAGEADAMMERERQRLEQLTAGWDEPSQADWGETDDKEAAVVQDVDTTSVQAAPSDANVIYKCIAVYNYTAQNSDELSIVENEQLEVIGEGDGDGWLRARNYRGEEGYVPHNYLDVDPAGGVSVQAAAAAGSYQLTTQISFSSVDYTVEEQDEPQNVPEVVTQPQKQAPPPLKDVVLPVMPTEPQENGLVCYCIAMYDYDATCPDELTFNEGQVLKILRKVVHDEVDDGWWEGELDNVVGLFPSLVVEECRANGEPLTPQDDDDAPSSAPPVFTPPDVPSFLLAPQQVIITSATPVVDGEDSPTTDDTTNKVTDSQPSSSSSTSAASQGFAMEMTKGQRKQYHTQFDSEGDNVESQPTMSGIPSFAMVLDDGDEQEAGGGNGKSKQPKMAIPDQGDGFGLGVASIVITCATPMIEEPEEPFPPPPTEEQAEPEIEMPLPEEDILPDIPETIPEEVEDPPDDQPADSAPFPISSSTGSEEDTYTGPSTAENSQSQPPPPAAEDTDQHKSSGGGRNSVSSAGQRGSIPDELDPQQLAQLQDLKESIA